MKELRLKHWILGMVMCVLSALHFTPAYAMKCRLNGANGPLVGSISMTPSLTVTPGQINARSFEAWRSPEQRLQVFCNEPTGNSERVYLHMGHPHPDFGALETYVLYNGVEYDMDGVNSSHRIDTGIDIPREGLQFTLTYRVIWRVDASARQMPSSVTMTNVTLFDIDGLNQGRQKPVIQLSGSVRTVTKTCNLATDSTSTVVSLPPIRSGDLATPNSEAGRTNFILRISECTTRQGAITLTFNGQPDQSNNSYFANQGTASGVALALRQDSRLITPIGNNRTAPVPIVPEVVINDTTRSFGATVALSASYVRVGPVTGGTLRSYAQFDINYP